MTRKTDVMAVARTARALLGLALFLLLAVFWLCLARRPGWRRPLARLGWSLLLSSFGIVVRQHGQPVPGVLIAANHITWVDIAVLGMLADAGFVAKAEVDRWPVIGILARHYACVFIDRNRRLHASAQADAMQAQLQASAGLILFPEGTTSDGEEVLPFRSSLFAVASRMECACVQPVAICYRNRDGSPLSPAGRRRIAWLGEDALLPHAMTLAASGGAAVDVWFETTVMAPNRKAIAEECRTIIASRVASCPADDQAATLKRAA